MIFQTNSVFAVSVVATCFLVLLAGLADAADDKSTELLALAGGEFGTLTEADKKLFRAVANGEFADFSSPNEKENNPADAQEWNDERVLSADRIIWLCANSQAREKVSHRGVRIKGARIEGKVDLAFCHIGFPLSIERSAIPAGIYLYTASVPQLSLLATHTSTFSASGLNVANALLLDDGFKAKGEVRLIGATIGGQLNCTGSEFNNPDGKALFAQSVNVTGSVLLSDGFKAKGEVSLAGATIGGDLDCCGGEFNNPDEIALFAQSANVTGNVFLRDGFKAEGMVTLGGATIGGELDCCGGEFSNPDGTALFAQSVKVDGSVLLSHGFKAEGKVILAGATIGGQLGCSGKFSSPDGMALFAVAANVTADAYLNRGFRAEGEVSLAGATIGGLLDCCGG